MFRQLSARLEQTSTGRNPLIPLRLRQDLVRTIPETLLVHRRPRLPRPRLDLRLYPKEGKPAFPEPTRPIHPPLRTRETDSRPRHPPFRTHQRLPSQPRHHRRLAVQRLLPARPAPNVLDPTSPVRAIPPLRSDRSLFPYLLKPQLLTPFPPRHPRDPPHNRPRRTSLSLRAPRHSAAARRRTRRPSPGIRTQRHNHMLIDVPYPSRSRHLGGRCRGISAGALDARKQGRVSLCSVLERAEDLSGAATGARTGHVCVT